MAHHLFNQVLTHQVSEAAAVEQTDENFANVVLLLKGDGSDGQGNTADLGNPSYKAFVDGSTSAHAITVNGDSYGNDFSPYYYDDGYWSNFFDGTNDELKTSSTSSDFAFGKEDFTVECFIRNETEDVTQQAIVGNRNGGNDQCWCLHYFSTANRIQWHTGTTVLAWMDILTQRNRWHHVAVSRSGGTLKMFLDGVEAESVADTKDYSVVNNLFIGYDIYAGDFNGQISNIRIVKGRALYTSSFTAPSAPFTDSTTSGELSAYFDGTGDYLSIGSNADFALGTGDFTIEMWVYAVKTTEQAIYDGRSANGAYPYLLIQGSTGKFIYYVSTGIRITADNTVPLNQWVHLSIARSSGTTKMFVNGTQQSGTYTDSTNYGQAPVVIGQNQPNGGENFEGYISNLRVVKGTALHTSSFTPSLSPLTTTSQSATASEVKLLTCQSKTFADESNSSHPISINGDARISEFGPFGDGYWSNYFDGNGDSLEIANSTDFKFGTGDFTIECWLFPTVSTQQSYAIVVKCAANTNWTGGWAIAFQNSPNNGKTSFWVNNSQLIGSGTALNQNQWNHIAVTRSGSTTNLYQNGSRVATTTNSYDFQPTQALTIASDLTHTNYEYQGYIKDLRILKGTALYTGTSYTQPTTNLEKITNTVLLTCQSNRFFDNSDSEHTVSLGDGTPQVSELIPFEYLKRQTKLITCQGNRFKDIIPDRYSIVINNGTPKISTNTPFTQSKTANVGSGYFDGNGDYVSVADSTDFTFGNSDFTVECWVYFKTVSGTQYVYGQSHSSAASATSIQLYSSGTTIYGWTGFGSASGTIKANEWTHVAFVRQSTNLRLYLNGKQTGTASAGTSSVTDSSGVFALGRVGAYAADYFNGFIADFNLIKGTCKYEDGIRFIPPTSTITAHANTKLLTCQYSGAVRNVGILDDSKYNSIATRAGDATLGTFSPFSVEEGHWSTMFQDDSSAYIRFAGSGASDFNLDDGASWCVEFWLFMNNSAVAYQRVAEHYVSTEYWAIKFDSGSTGKICIGRTDTAGNGVLASAAAIPEHQWVHVAFTNDGSTLRIFVNGALSNSASSWTQDWANATSGTPSVQLSNYRALGYTLRGSISNFRIVKGDSVYTSAFTVPSEPLTAISGTQLLCLQSNTYKDNSTNNYTSTIGSSVFPKLLPFSPFPPTRSYSKDVVGGSVFLDGTGDRVDYDPIQLRGIGTGDFTIEVWWYPINVYSSFPAVFSVGTNGSYSNILNIGINNYANKDFGIAINEGTANDFTTGNNSWKEFAWNHLVVTRQGTTFCFFSNGVRLNSITNSQSLGTGQAVAYLGSQWWDGARTLGGYFSGFRVVVGEAVYGVGSTLTVPTAPVSDTSNTTILSNFTNAGIFDHSCKSNLYATGDVRIDTSVKKFNTGSIYFDGSGDYLTATHSAHANQFFSPQEGDYTWEMFVRFAVLSGGSLYTLFSKYGSASEYQFYYNAGNHWNLSHGATTKSWADTSIVTDTWYHIALVKDGTDYELFKDGTSLGTNAFSNPTAGTRPFVLGTTFGGSNNALYQLNGYLDEVRLTKGVARYTSNFTPPTQTFPNK